MLNLVLFGPPGSGKGTQSAKLIEKYHLVHLSTGDILRGELAAKSTLGLEAKKYMDKGELVPDQVVIDMIGKKLDASKGSRGFIFDGFPRTTSQAEALDDLLNKRGMSITLMAALEVPHDELVKRLLNRGKESGRADDQNPEIIENRIRVYHKETSPVINYYEACGKFHPVEGVGAIDDIFNRLCTVIDHCN